MGSSSGDSSTPPTNPTPTGVPIAAPGQSTPYRPNFINFLGDTNVPSTGLTPEMLAQIMASNGPPPGQMSPPSGMGGGPPGQAAPVDRRALLARAMQQQQQQLGLGRNGSAGGGGPGAGGGMGGGWGGH